MTILLAHIRHSDFAEQSVQAHLEGVASLARYYGEPVNLGAHAELAGFLHDMGKNTVHFTTYLKNAVLEGEIAQKKIDHSTAGAKYLYRKYYRQSSVQNYVVETVGMAILSHHSGMQNFIQPDLKQSDYIRRVTNEELPYYDEVVENFESIPGNVERVRRLVKECLFEFQAFMEKVRSLDERPVYLNLMQKLVFSCLIDADRTDTRCFEENEESQTSQNKDLFTKAYDNMMETVTEWKKGTVSSINKLRNDMSESNDRFASQPSGIYTLTVPTGGGKTFASLRYALKHANLHSKERIIYVVPYTTILEQNAEVVRKIIKQPESVLEHHANVIDDATLDQKEDFYQNDYHKKLQLGRDNWDYPIIFTTMVQFLDAFYQKGTRKSRRIHNLTNAVIIFDEVQSVPYQHTELFNIAVNFLHKIGNSSVLLCTATQPAVDKMKHPILLSENAEIVENLDEVVEAFKRVEFHNHVGLEGWDAEEISIFAQQIIEESNSILIILNTKTAVRKLYEHLSEQIDVSVEHLSTSMCPAHRKEKLAKIKGKLGKEKVICISTQLIEAGVDISFETVIRSLAGLDSIVQAAGRCNRNNELDMGHVYIIRAKDERLSRLPEIKIGGEVTETYVLSDEKYAKNLLSQKAHEVYFTHFRAQANRQILKNPRGFDYELKSLIDGNFASKKKGETLSISMFKTLEKHFEAIDSPTTAVLVPYGKGKDIILALNEDIKDFSYFNQLIKEAQQYSVNLFEHELQKLSSENLISPLYDDTIYCLNERAYREDFGVTLEGEASFENLNY